MEKNVYRASSIDGWNICQRRAYAASHAEEIEESGIRLNPSSSSYASFAGTAVHALAEMEPGPERDDKLDDYCDTKQKEEDTDAIIGNSILDSWNDVRSKVRSCLAKLDELPEAELFRDQSEATLREQYLSTADMYDDFEITGHMDLYNIDKRRLLDIKCSGAYQAGRYYAQIGAYSILIKNQDLPIPEKADIVFLPFRDKPAELVPHDPFDSVKHMKNTLATAESSQRRVIEIAAHNEREVDGNDLPASPGCWACSEKWCRAYNTKFCHAYKE